MIVAPESEEPKSDCKLVSHYLPFKHFGSLNRYLNILKLTFHYLNIRRFYIKMKFLFLFFLFKYN